MKKIVFLLLIAISFSCTSEKEKTTKNNIEESKSLNEKTNSQEEVKEASTSPIKETSLEKEQNNLVTAFLNDVSNLEKESNGNPIVKFQEIAQTSAQKIIPVNKENMEAVLKKAKAYKYCVITTGDHTIIKIDNLENCKPSGSWSTCMPYGEGFIKKGALKPVKDYANFVIGRPDSQKRIAYLFN
ncbi:hypothetical protein [Xanthovirga aplysinae]|uniref:hypothetical protein n=1 Tax=Xanthovirga aplysinae TaxID=2529853 RepID=UPI0012BBCA59|nr:hypothetical protein [Xanthovirga aplysinae]MTI31358.1 hypothetical protein [Xanthovirga aplysinae]